MKSMEKVLTSGNGAKSTSPAVGQSLMVSHLPTKTPKWPGLGRPF